MNFFKLFLHKITLLHIILILSWPCSLSAQQYQSDDGYAEFQSEVPLHSFTGKSNHLTGLIDFDQDLVDFYLDLSTLKTGNSRRDRDMLSVLNADKFPFAEFTGSIISEFDLHSEDKQPVTVEGDFTLNGITVRRSIDGTIEVRDESLLVETSWVLDITDHQIEPPGILFYRVRDEMDISIEIKLINEQNE